MKRFACVVLCLLLVLTFAGCAPAEDAPMPSQSPVPIPAGEDFISNTPQRTVPLEDTPAGSLLPMEKLEKNQLVLFYQDKPVVMTLGMDEEDLRASLGEDYIENADRNCSDFRLQEVFDLLISRDKDNNNTVMSLGIYDRKAGYFYGGIAVGDSRDDVIEKWGGLDSYLSEDDCMRYSMNAQHKEEKDYDKAAYFVSFSMEDDKIEQVLLLDRKELD